jgi:hypothetical protein
MGGGGGRLPGAMGSGGRGGAMGGGGAATQDPQTVFYVQSGNDAQYKTLPVMVTVLIDQDRVQDFLVELENSPMAIQVMDFELQRPTARVTKPEKGADSSSMGMGMGMGGMGGLGRGLSAYGGMASMMQNQMSMMQKNQQGAMGGMFNRMMSGNMGAGGAPEKKKTGKDVRSVDQKKARTTREDNAKDVKGPSFFDPYFDIVQVTVYGQARFFNPPPAPPEGAPSLGDAAGAAGAPAAGAAPSDASARGAQTPAAEPKDQAAPEKGQAPTGTAEPKANVPPGAAEPKADAPADAGEPKANAPADTAEPKANAPADNTKPASPSPAAPKAGASPKTSS